MKKEFEKLDQDKDGKLNKDDLSQIVHTDTMSYGKIDIQSMIDEADLDGDGKIDYQEFLTLLREKTRTIFVINKWLHQYTSKQTATSTKNDTLSRIWINYELSFVYVAYWY